MIPRTQPLVRKSENSCDLAAAGTGRLLLLIAVLMTLSGMLAISLRGGGSSFNSWLFLDLGFSDRAAKGIERFVLLLALAMTAVPICLPEKKKCLFFLLPAFLFLLAESFLTAHMGGMGYANWAPSAYALRYATPLALMMFLFQAPFGGAQAGSLLRIALALVFLTHGAEAFLHHPRFVDLIINSASNLPGWRVEEATAKNILSWIGVMDMTLAIAVVIRPFRALLWWMAAWGLITALARLTANGWGAYPELLLRTTHFVVPLVLVKFRAESGKENPATETDSPDEA